MLRGTEGRYHYTFTLMVHSKGKAVKPPPHLRRLVRDVPGVGSGDSRPARRCRQITCSSLLPGLVVLMLVAGTAEATDRLVFAGAETTDALAAAAILAEAYAQLDIDIEVRTMPGQAALAQANSGMVAGDVQRIDGIQRQFTNLVQIAVPVNYIQGVAFARRQLPIEAWYSLHPYRVGVVRGILFSERNTRGMDVTVTESAEDLLDLLDEDVIDVAIIPRLAGLVAISARPGSKIVQVGAILENILLYHYLHRDHATLVPRLDKVLKAMLRDGTTRRIRDETYARILEAAP